VCTHQELASRRGITFISVDVILIVEFQSTENP
jgi:hypothetical protein